MNEAKAYVETVCRRHSSPFRRGIPCGPQSSLTEIPGETEEWGDGGVPEPNNDERALELVSWKNSN